MSDETAVRLLTEIRDLLREQGEQGERQRAAIADQQQAVAAYRSLLRRTAPVIGLVLLLILAILLVLFVGVWRRYSG